MEEKRIKSLRNFMKDIEKVNNKIFEYTKCLNWKGHICPTIECSSCIAKQALFIDKKLKKES